MLIEILRNTPIWVWALFAALVYLGLFQSRPHMVARRRVAVLPGIFIGLSLFGVWSAFGAAATGFALWACGVLAALWLNRILKLPRLVRFDPATQKFSLPGSFVPMLLMMSIFATKYALAVAMSLNQGLAGSAAFAGGVSLAYGFFSGTFLARSLRILASARPNNATAQPENLEHRSAASRAVAG